MQTINVKTITASAGRKVAYTEFGSSSGHPVIYAHNTLGSHVEGLYFDKIANEHGLRLIVINRPGIAYSDYQESRDLFDFIYDVEMIMKSFNLATVGMIGWGAGADYVLACAYKIPELLDFAICLSYDDKKETHIELKNTILFSAFKLTQHFPKLLSKVFKLTASKEDQLVINDPIIQDIMLENIKAIMTGPKKGPLDDLNISAQKPNYNINDIVMPIYFYTSKHKNLMSSNKMNRIIQLMPFSKLYTFDDPCALYPLKAACQEKIFNDISDIIFKRAEIKEIISHSL